MPETPSYRFVMYGARTAVAGGLFHIQQQVEALESAINENTGLAFDLAKTIIESTCRTILSDRRIGFEPDDDLPGLFKTTRNTLPFLPATASGSSDVRKSLAQTLGGLTAAVQGICELRNECGFASHGSDGPRPVLESVQAMLAAEAADTIVGFLYRVHTQEREVAPAKSDPYSSNLDFNEYVDEIHERVIVFDEDFPPSRVLFEMAPEPYRLYLAEYRQGVDIPEDEEIEVPEERGIELPEEDVVEVPGEQSIEVPEKDAIELAQEPEIELSEEQEIELPEEPEIQLPEDEKNGIS